MNNEALIFFLAGALSYGAFSDGWRLVAQLMKNWRREHD